MVWTIAWSEWIPLIPLFIQMKIMSVWIVLTCKSHVLKSHFPPTHLDSSASAQISSGVEQLVDSLQILDASSCPPPSETQQILWDQMIWVSVCRALRTRPGSQASSAQMWEKFEIFLNFQQSTTEGVSIEGCVVYSVLARSHYSLSFMDVKLFMTFCGLEESFTLLLFSTGHKAAHVTLHHVEWKYFQLWYEHV